MIFEYIRIEEGMFQKKFDFVAKNNLVFSERNSRGKTSLLRFLLYSIGYNIPSTKGFRFDICSTETGIRTKKGLIVLRRQNNDFITADINGVKKTYILPDQASDLHAIIFESNNRDILENILGVIYTDQEKGWTLLNRGTVIGNIHFNIEELLRGLSDCDCDDLLDKEKELSRELSKCRQMLKVAEYREKYAAEINSLVLDTEEAKQAAEINSLLLLQKSLKQELKRIDDNISNNVKFKEYVANLNILVKLPDGSVFPLSENHISGLEESINLLFAKRKMLAARIKSLNNKIAEREKKSVRDEEDKTLFKMENILETIDKKIATLPVNSSVIKSEIHKTEARLKEIRKAISFKTMSDSRLINSLYGNMVKYATELGVGSNKSLSPKYLFTSNLKELTGAVLHKLVFSFRLAYLIELEKKLGLKLPIILDSPSGKEIDAENMKIMMNILRRDFSDNQIIIASIFDNFFSDFNKIIIRNRLIE